MKGHLTFIDRPYRPSDWFIRLHFRRYLVIVCRGDDYGEQEIENFTEELGVSDGEIDTGDPRWSTPLGSHVHLPHKAENERIVSHPLNFWLGNTPLKEHHR